MSDIFSEHKEPEEHFLPLNAKRYAEFYSLEMDSFNDDIVFYKAHCEKGSSVLELGCGTGRISRALTSSGYSVSGLDLSLGMLQLAKNNSVPPSPSYICADMTRMAFNTRFTNILIPYNTLNLLRSSSLITACLQQVHRCLTSSGCLLLQLHIPDHELMAIKGEKRFQFQMFPLPDNQGKLIKETLRSYNDTTGEIQLEERYRVRPSANNGPREDLSHTLHLAGFSVDRWLMILRDCGFRTLSCFGDYNSGPFKTESDTLLLIKAFPA